MHTEHLQNVHPVRVLGGWLFAVAVTSVVVLVRKSATMMARPTATSAAATVMRKKRRTWAS